MNKPKQGAPMRKDRAQLQNVPIDYDNQVERKLTNPKLLQFELDEPSLCPVKLPRKRAQPSADRRSVLRTNGKLKPRCAAGKNQVAAWVA